MAKATVSESTQTLASLYSKYEDTSMIEQCKLFAKWTLPQVYPDMTQGFNQNKIEYDCQSIGALLVNKLSTRLAGILFPAKQSFFTLELADEAKQMLNGKVKDIITFENKVHKRVFMNAAYAQIIYLMRLLIITGQGLVHRKDGKMRVFSTQSHVTKRNNVGDVLDIIIREEITASELTPEHLAKLDGDIPSDKKFKLYTRVKKITKFMGADRVRIDSWELTQELDNIPLDVRETYTEHLCPYFVVTWSLVNGDNYGRGYVEEYKSDMYKLSTMSRAATDYEFEMLRLIHLIDPSGQVDVKAFDDAVAGDYVMGRADAISGYDNGDANKLQQVVSDLSMVEQRLNIAFMRGDNTRQAERVTAYEIQMNALETEQTLGGVYSQLAESLHLPLAYLLINEVDATVMDDFQRNNLSLDIMVGLQALARAVENQGLVTAASEINATVPILSQVNPKFSPSRIASNILAANGVDEESISYTEEELLAKQQQEEQQRQMQEQQAMMQQQQSVQQLGTQEGAVAALSDAQGFAQ